MKTRILSALAICLTMAPLAAHAQASTTAPTSGPRREMSAERRDAMRARREARAAMTPEQREAAQAARKARFEAMPPEQQQFMRDLRTYQQGLREKSRELQSQVKSGALTRDEMAKQLKAYRDANRPARPASMPTKPRTP